MRFGTSKFEDMLIFHHKYIIHFKKHLYFVKFRFIMKIDRYIDKILLYKYINS